MLLTLIACGLGTPTPEKASQPPVDKASAPVTLAPRETPYRNLLVIVIDTTRADLLAQAHTPVIDALAARGQSVERAWSAGTWTVPGVTSLMSGAPVRGHGWDLGTGKLGDYPALPQIPLLAEVLKAEGFATMGLHSNSYLAEELGFDRGFDQWRRVSDPAMARELERELGRTWKPEGRNFVYLHYIGPHSPLSPSEQAMERGGLDPSWYSERMGMEIGVAKRDRIPGARSAYKAGYIAVLEDTDVRIGQALELLAPYLDDTLILLTSDHGELLGEHGVVGHGYWVHEPLTWVPFIAVGVEQPLPRAMSTAALASLATANLGITHAWPVTPSSPISSQREGKLALTDGQYKGVWDGESVSYYDLLADPGELLPLDTDMKLNSLKEAFETQFPAGTLAQVPVKLSEETEQGLRELGYVE